MKCTTDIMKLPTQILSVLRLESNLQKLVFIENAVVLANESAHTQMLRRLLRTCIFSADFNNQAVFTLCSHLKKLSSDASMEAGEELSEKTSINKLPPPPPADGVEFRFIRSVKGWEELWERNTSKHYF